MTKKRVIATALAMCAAAATQATANTVYYKCETKNGTTFSQFPCDEQAQEHEVRHSNVEIKPLDNNFSKQLTELQLEQRRDNIELQLRSTKHRLVILKRERSAKTLAEEQRLERLMSDDERKALKKEVNANIKGIEQRYNERIKQMEKRLAQLEKSLKKYQ